MTMIDAAATTKSAACPRCKAAMGIDEKFCSACGSDRATEEAAAALEAKCVRDTRACMIALAGFYAVVGLLAIAIYHHRLTSNGFAIVLGINVGVALFHVGLWLWAKRTPLAPALVALVMWVTLQALVLVNNPKALINTYYVLIAFVAVLIKAIQSGLQVHRLRAGRRS